MQDPIYLGDYPEYMREMLGERLPRFTPEETAVVLGSSEFYGMNTYTTNLCSACRSFAIVSLAFFVLSSPARRWPMAREKRVRML